MPCNFLPPDLLEEYKKAFQILDRKNIGKISLRDLARVSCSIGIQLTNDDLTNVAHNIIGLQYFDTMQSCLDFNLFLEAMITILTDCISDDEIKRIFREFDKDGDGFISPHELRALLLRLGDDVTEKDVEEMMMVADKDGDGLVSLCEFIDVMTASPSMTSQHPHNYVTEHKVCSRQSSVDSRIFVTSSHKHITSSDTKPKRRRKSLLDWMKGVTSSNSDVTKCNNNEKNNFQSGFQAIRRVSKTLSF